MKDIKTTISGAVAALAIVVKFVFKVDIPDEVVAAVVTVAVFCAGFFAKDKEVTK